MIRLQMENSTIQECIFRIVFKSAKSNGGLKYSSQIQRILINLVDALAERSVGGVCGLTFREDGEKRLPLSDSLLPLS